MHRSRLGQVGSRPWAMRLAGLGGVALFTYCCAAIASAEPSATTIGTASLPASAFATPTWNGGDLIAASTPYAEARRWRRAPRPYYGRREYRRNSQEWLTVRGGFFDADDVRENDWLVGLKVSGEVANNLSLGVSTDLHRRSDAERSRVEEFRDPAGNLVRTTVTTFESSSNLIPILGVVEMKFPASGIQPYVGLGAGYEVLVVDGTDFASGNDFSDTFGGFGWQGHAGLSFPLGPSTRLVGEGFWNHSTVTRKVRDELTGERVKEEIDVNGVGMRAGIAFGL